MAALLPLATAGAVAVSREFARVLLVAAALAAQLWLTGLVSVDAARARAFGKGSGFSQQPNVRALVFLLPIPDEPHAVRSRTIEDRRPAEAAGTK